MNEIRMVKTDVGFVSPLRCPRCGNDGSEAFNADTYVLIGRDGHPQLVGDYAEASAPVIDCHGCDYRGPIEEFAASSDQPRPEPHRVEEEKLSATRAEGDRLPGDT